MRTVIIGAGGHARTIAAMVGKDVLGILDRDTKSVGEKICGFEVIGDYHELNKLEIERAYLAFGDNLERARWFGFCNANFISLPQLFHPTSYFDKTAKIGIAVTMCAHSIVGAEAEIGDGVLINTGAIVDHETVVGDFAHVCPGARIAGRVTVGKGALVGVGSTVKNGVTIGEGVIVGAGAVVIEDAPDGSTVVGVPASPINYDDRERGARIADARALQAETEGEAVIATVIAETIREA